MSVSTITTEQVRELIEQLAAMTAAASITPELVANIFENMRQLNDQEREKVIEVAEEYIQEIQDLGIAADHVTLDSGATVEAEVSAILSEVFPLTVAVVSSNAGVFEIGTDIDPLIELSIKRRDVDIPAPDFTQNVSPTPAYISPDKRTVYGNRISSGTVTYQIAVSQGGQTKSVANQVFDFMNYRYYGVINSATEPTKAQVKTLCENGTLTKQLSRSTTKGATDLAANKCYVFVVPNTNVNLIVKNAKSGNPISGCTVDTVTINRVNGTDAVSCKYVIVPSGAAAWTFEITN